MQGSESEYVSNLAMYNSLREEIVFIINQAIRDNNIKIHEIESRVKTWDSILAKSKRKNSAAPLVDINDIVGARVICLFPVGY